jgi:cytidine deaminase
MTAIISSMKRSSYAELSEPDKALIDAAEQAMQNGYAPYAKFYVGAALLTQSGETYTGSNVETASYVALCAERVAVGAAVSSGDYQFEAIGIISKSDHFDVTQVSGPCGICRQLLFEFSQVSGNDIRVINSTTNKDKIVIAKISELIPLCWGPLDTETDISKYRTKSTRQYL